MEEFIIKSRYIWDVRALQMLRQRAAAEYARRAVPRVVNGVRIEFPETEISVGLRISVRSRRIAGRALFEMLYDRQAREYALDMAMIALEALCQAEVTPDPFALFRSAYDFVRIRKMFWGEMLGQALLSREQKGKLKHLAENCARRREDDRAVLVHGDLHASHLIVGLAEKSLGFVDLEMMHVGKPVTNFAQLWIGVHFADPLLGREFYQRYANRFPETLDRQFDDDARVEVAIRCYSMIRDGKRVGNVAMEKAARALLGNILDESFERICLRGTLR